ncbi:MAG: hypothetical protein LBC33_00035 [Mycoplasmataceae bacterium]|nr:hypothetical protein [Mycoplasmataceae bacterium]
MPKFPQRELERIINLICLKNHWKVEWFADGWICAITAAKQPQYIFGYNFFINDVSSSKICSDKAATSEILNRAKIPAFVHYYFRNHFYHEQELIATFKKLKNNVVIKPNEGTSGIAVLHCTKQKTFLKEAIRILTEYQTLAISPFYAYENEYRLVIYQQHVVIHYQKHRPYLIGDGKHSLAQLIKIHKIHNAEILPIKNIPKNGEKIPLTWKHNLGQGAKITENIPLPLLNRLTKLALKVQKLLGIKFFSIDFAVTNQWIKVVEVNSGVMLEHFAGINRKNFQRVYDLYFRVLKDALKR